jgi:hypothetical protein
MPKQISPEQVAWIRDVARSQRFGAGDRIGSVNLIDDSARYRAIRSIRAGNTLCLGRTLQRSAAGRHPGFQIKAFSEYHDNPSSIPVVVGLDQVELHCHGVLNTHIDALNHQGIDNTWYGGWAVDDPTAPSIRDWATKGIFTRAVHADIPAIRGGAWVDENLPVGARDIERALAAKGVTCEPGDALILDMPRGVPPSGLRPGLGSSGIRWIIEHDVSVLCWDFLDAVHPDEPYPFAHFLIWAAGLAVIDNCDFGAIHGQESLPGECALVLAPLPIPGGTGCNINPLLVF